MDRHSGIDKFRNCATSELPNSLQLLTIQSPKPQLIPNLTRILRIHQEQTRHLFVRSHQDPRHQRILVVLQALLLPIIAYDEQREIMRWTLNLVLFEQQLNDILRVDQRRHPDAHLWAARRREEGRFSVVEMTVDGAAALEFGTGATEILPLDCKRIQCVHVWLMILIACGLISCNFYLIHISLHTYRFITTHSFIMFSHWYKNKIIDISSHAYSEYFQ